MGIFYIKHYFKVKHKFFVSEFQKQAFWLKRLYSTDDSLITLSRTGILMYVIWNH